MRILFRASMILLTAMLLVLVGIAVVLIQFIRDIDALLR